MSEVLAISEPLEVAPSIAGSTLGVSRESVPPVAEIDLVSAQDKTEQVFKHTLGDGREVEGTLEHARKVCPVIGRLSIEKARETLAQADLIARVAQRGKERRANEAAKAAGAELFTKESGRAKAPVSKTEVSVKPVAERPNDGQARSVSIERLANEETVVSSPVIEPRALPHNQQSRNVEKPTGEREDNPSSSIALVLIAEAREHEADVVLEQVATEPAGSVLGKLTQPTVSRELPVMQLPSVAVEQMIPAQGELFVAGPHEAAEEIERPTQQAIDMVEQSTAIDVAKLRAEIAELYVGGVSEEAASPEVGAIEYPVSGVINVVSERPTAESIIGEVIELQQQLTAAAETMPDLEPGVGLALLLETERLLQEEAMMTEAAFLAEPIELAPDAVISLRQGNVEIAPADSAEPAAANPLHEVAIQAQGQPLELSLARVARLLKSEIARGDDGNGSLESLPPQAQDIVEVVVDLKAALAEAGADAATVRLSPRVVAEMVRLLGALGYEQPQEILLAFAQEHGLQSLLEMMEYLCQLSHHENRKEFAPDSLGSWGFGAATGRDDSDPRKTVLARALFWLMRRLVASPFVALSGVDSAAL